jgi:flagellar biosynthesis/type III secretory pathway chaperone
MTSDLNSFVSLLKTDIAVLSAMEQILAAERGALESRDLPTLQELTIEKNKYLNLTRENARKRLTWLDGTGLSKQRFLDLVRVKAASVYALYVEAEKKVRTIHGMNAINGKILARTQQANQRLMDIIRGKGVMPADLYTQAGRKLSADEGSQPLAQA